MTKMDHVAILDRKYLTKILSGDKTIESRWSIYEIAPYKQVSTNDKIYLKVSGGKVIAKAKAGKCLFFDNLDSKENLRLFKKYNNKIKADKSYFNRIKNRKFCTLIFLKNVSEIPSFDINRNGFGSGAAWLPVKNINQFKKSKSS